MFNSLIPGSDVWRNVALASAFVLAFATLAPLVWRALRPSCARLACGLKRRPLGASLLVLAVGALLAYAGDKPTPGPDYTITPTSFRGEYDGEEHAGSLVVMTNGVDITAECARYGTAEEGPFEATELQGYVDAGTYTNWYCVTKVDGSATTNFIEVAISPATIDMSGVTFEGVSKNYDGDKTVVTASGVPDGVTADYENNEFETISRGPQTAKATFAATDANHVPSVKELTATVEISPKPVTVTPVAASKAYGAADPELTAKFEGLLSADESKVGDMIGYTVYRTEGENVGKYDMSVTVVSRIEYYDFDAKGLEGGFTITPCDFTGTVVIEEIPDEQWTGEAIEPVVTVSVGGKTLKKDTDYTVAYANNVERGTEAKATVTGKGNYTGEKTATFAIIPRTLDGSMVAAIPNQAFIGEEIKPAVTVMFGGKALTLDTDYTVTYANNVNVGTAKATVEGKGNFTGMVNREFQIVIPEGDLTVGQPEAVTYSGEDQTPVLVVKIGDVELNVGTDYEVKWTKGNELVLDGCKDAGEYAAEVTGKGNYEGKTASTTFTINPKELDDEMIGELEGQLYTGSAIVPEVVVKDGKAVLVKDKDYTLVCSNNVEVTDLMEGGYAIATVTGLGNYTGTAEKPFEIILGKVSYTPEILTPGVEATFMATAGAGGEFMRWKGYGVEQLVARGVLAEADLTKPELTFIVPDDCPSAELFEASFGKVSEVVTVVFIDGDATNSTRKVIRGEKLGELPALEVRLGVTFKGWYTKPNGKGSMAKADTAASEKYAALYAYWKVVGEADEPKFAFAETELTVNEGEALVLAVEGNDLPEDRTATVQVMAIYNTAAAADLDLKKATTNEAAVKSFKFPLTLTWNPGAEATQTVELPVVKDKAVELDEVVTFQLLNPANAALELPKNTLTVTIHDPDFDVLRAKVEGGTATAAEAKAYQKLVDSRKDKAYVRGLPNDATRGKVSGSALAADGKKVTLKATVNKGYVFAGWYAGADCAEGEEIAAFGDYRNPSLAYEAVASDGDVDIWAKFILPSEDSLELDDAFLPKEIKVGEPFSAAVPVTSVSLPTITVSGLPTGLKFTAKDVMKKSSKTEVEIPANTVYGTPTKVTTKPATVKVVVKNSGGYTITRSYEMSVVAGEPSAESKVITDAAPFNAVAITLNDDLAGKVTGVGVYQAGKKVTLKATANKGFVFNGWYDADDELVAQLASYAFNMPSNALDFVAKFVTAEEDRLSIAADVDSFSFDAEMTAAETNVMAGVYLMWPVCASALSQPTVKVSGLPSGLKFTAKDILKKGSKTEVEIPANTIYGAPTAVSKIDRNGVVTPSLVKISVTTAGKSKADYTIALTVRELPGWACGTFSGNVDGAMLPNRSCWRGSASMTVADGGKISGKMLVNGTNVSFTATNFDIESTTEGETNLVAVISGKVGKNAVSGVIEFSETGIVCEDFAEAHVSFDQNVWKIKDASGKLPQVPTEYQGLYTVGLASEKGTGYLSLTIGKDGAIKVSGKAPDGTALTGSATLNPIADDDSLFGWAYVFCAPTSYKGGYVATKLTFSKEGEVSGGVDCDWVSFDPKATDDYGEGFLRTMDVTGAWYSKTADLREYYTTLKFESEYRGLSVKPACWEFLTLSVDEKGKGFVVDQGKATKPVQDKTTKEWSYEGANDAGLTISFAQATGIWKGSFIWWFEDDNHKQTSTKVAFEGILVLGSDLCGSGVFDNTGIDDKGKAYKFKDSVPVSFRQPEL